MDSHCFKLHRSYLISFNLSNVGKIFWVESEGTVSKFWKRKRKFLCVLTYPIKRARQIRKFHVAVVQRRLRNIQKSVMHVQSCYFANINLFLFLPFSLKSPSSLLKLPIAVIQKFCYHGKVTLHFSSLLNVVHRQVLKRSLTGFIAIPLY